MKLPLKYLIALLSLVLTMQVGHVAASMRIAESGEVLLFPYYAAGEGYDTFVSITNTSGMVKGVRVAIREGMRGNEVLSWHIYLAPYEQMGFAIIQNGDGGAVITKSLACTVPGFPQYEPVDFVNYLYAGDSVNTLDRTLSGYLEVIEMGQWDPAVGLGMAAATSDCGELVSAWTSSTVGTGYWLADASAEALDWQGGGLIGQALIKEFDATSYRSITVLEYSAVAVADFARQKAPAEYHIQPGSPTNLLTQGSLVLNREIGGQSSTYTAASGLDALSALLTSTQLFAVPPPTSSASEPQKWLLSMPTKFHHESSGQLGPFSSQWSSAESKACEHVDIGGEVKNAIYRDYLIDAPPFETLLCGVTNFLAVGSDGSDPIRSPGLLTTYVDSNSVDVTSTRMARSSPFNDANDRRIAVSDGAESVSFVGLPVIAIPIYGNVPAGPITDKGVMSDSLTRYLEGMSLQVDSITRANPSVAIIEFSGETGAVFAGAPFTVTCVDKNGFSLFATGSAAQSPVTVTGLEESVSYSCNLFAETALGNSEPVSFSIGTDQPAQPVIEKVEPGDGEIYLSVADVAGGSPAVQYNGSCTDGSQTASATSSSPLIVVSGLTNDVPYICSVTVTNASNLTSVASAATAPIRPEALKAGLPVWLIYEASQ